MFVWPCIKAQLMSLARHSFIISHTSKLNRRPFQCSLQPFWKKIMSTDNVGLWIAEREPQSPQAIDLGDPRLLVLSPQLKKIYCAVIDSGLRLPTLELTAAYA